MHRITRRSALAAIVSLPAISGARSASSAQPLSDSGQPLEALHGPPEALPSRPARLAEELSIVMDGYLDGRFHAEVYPASQHQYPVAFVNTKARDFHHREDAAIRSAAREVVAALKARTAAFGALETSPIGFGSRDRWKAVVEARQDLADALAWLAHVVDGDVDQLAA